MELERCELAHEARGTVMPGGLEADPTARWWNPIGTMSKLRRTVVELGWAPSLSLSNDGGELETCGKGRAKRESTMDCRNREATGRTWRDSVATTMGLVADNLKRRDWAAGWRRR